MKRTMVLTATAGLLALAAMAPLPTLSAAYADDTAKADETQSVETVTLDTSSFLKFRASVDAMKATLTEADQERLMTAFDKLAAMSMEPAAGGTVAPAPSSYGGKAMSSSTIEVVYDKYADKLNGKTFGEVIALAG